MKARWLIVAVSAAIFFGGNLMTSLQDPWFQNLERPGWLTFEFLIPIIWTVIWICATVSAIIVWEQGTQRSRSDSGESSSHPWWAMVLYASVALLTSFYSPTVVELQSLWGGLIVGGTATLLAYSLAILVRRISKRAAGLLIPYLLWGPIGTYLTWVLLDLNVLSSR